MSYTETRQNKYTCGVVWKGLTHHDGRLIINPTYCGSYLYQAAYNYTRTGTKVLNYQQLIRDGKQAGSPYTLEAQKIVDLKPGYFTSRYLYLDSWLGLRAHQRGERTGIMHAFPVSTISHLSTSLAKAEATALQKTYHKIRQEQQTLNSPAVLAEILDVIRQFGRPFEAIVDLTNRRLNKLELAKRGLRGSTSFKKLRYAEIVASTYLEYAFGLAPLISDTEKVAEALAKFNNERSDENLSKFRSRIRSRGVDEAIQKTTTTGNVGCDQYSAAKLTTVTKTECRVQYVVGLDMTPIADFGSNDRLMQLLGFKPENWIPGIWEAVPWSWLVDYFTNVSSILDAAVTTTTGVRWIVKTVTYRTEQDNMASIDRETTRQRIAGTSVRLQHMSGTLGSFKTVRTTLTRTLPPTLGVPPLVIEHPFDDVKKLTNMAAVLLSRKPGQSAVWLT